MECTLKKYHKGADPKYTGLFVTCPHFSDRQICYWCCLHIQDLVNPATRGRVIEMGSPYADIDELSDNEACWYVCDRCSRGN